MSLFFLFFTYFHPYRWVKDISKQWLTMACTRTRDAARAAVVGRWVRNYLDKRTIMSHSVIHENKYAHNQA